MVEDFFVELRGLKFHYRDWKGEGAPLILLPGLASNSHIFDLVAPLLAKHFRVVALDQRGHGESAKPDDGYDFENVVADLSSFLDALRVEHAIIAGHSWGGNVALQFGAEHPERSAALVLIDGGFLDLQANPEMTWERTEKELAPPRLAGMPLVEFKQLLRQYVGARWKPSVEAAILGNFELMSDGTIRPHLSFEHHMQILRALWEQRPGNFYPSIRCPVLLCPALEQPRDERAKKYAASKLATVKAAERALSHSETVWFRGTVHDVPLHRPRKLANAITRFAREFRSLR